MGNRRGAQVPTSDDEDDAPPPRNSNGDDSRNTRKRKMVQLPDDYEDEEEKEMEEAKPNEENVEKEKSEEPENQDMCEDDEQDDLEAQPLGEVIRVSGKGKWKRKHYASFEYDGIQYELEDSVLLVPEDSKLKPYVALIKDITAKDGSVMVTGQRFYRQEEAEKKGGGNWKSRDTRELFYSFHRDEVPAESVMHKCVVHFIPRNKQIPNRKEHPGFIVQKVYDTEQRRLFKLTDKDYEEDKQHEINILVDKTLARLGDLPDLEPEATFVDNEDDIKNKWLLRKRNLSHLDVSRDDDGLDRPPSLKVETPGSVCTDASEYYTILSKFKLLTGETQRDKWLEKLLQSIQFICTPKQEFDEEKGENKNGSSNHRNENPDKIANHGTYFDWPDAAVPAVAALEKAAHETLSADYQKYNQKMRQLTFNLKDNTLLARCVLNGELEPARVLNMLPNELKSGLTAEEIASREPEESGCIQGKWRHMGGGEKRRVNNGTPHVSLTLREKSSGKKQGHVNAKTMCKLDHLKSLAVWAATKASIPSLGAFFGERLAATTEALGIQSDPSLFFCERCESILQPGHNCIVRIEKNHPKMQCRHKKSSLTTQNIVVYTCHFCSHQNLMKGTPKGYVKEICSPKPKPQRKLQPAKSVQKHTSITKLAATNLTIITLDNVAKPISKRQNLDASSLMPSLPTTGPSLLDSKRKKRNRSAAKKVAEPEPGVISTIVDKSATSSKRRKKSWTSLKEIAQSSENDASKKKLTKLTIPFFI